MNFATIKYLIFIILVFAIYWRLGRKKQNLFLLLASYFFYANWDWRFLSLIIISTLTDYASGLLIYGTDSIRRRRFILIISLIINLAILGYFKYFNFFAGSFVALAGTVGWHVSWTTARIILPVGISFYTFQSISYTVDIYRRQLTPTRSFIDFAAFVAFFPQLVAGPIVRAKEFVYQLETRRSFSIENLQQGLIRFMLGFFKKAVIADTLAIHLVDPVFADPSAYTSGTLWLALFGWTVQIYADFSGYSSMAIGSAKILGFDIPENFRFPYLSWNISQYWQRWHMTMSRFFRDYVYIGLGGNRKGTVRSMINIAATTFVSGLWHGAGWTFVTWGWLHGFYIVVFQSWRSWRKKLGKWNKNPGFPNVIPGWILTTLAVCLSRILFRSPNFATAWKYTKGLFTSEGKSVMDLPFIIIICFGAIIIDHIAGWFMEYNPGWEKRIPAVATAVLFSAIFIFIYYAYPQNVHPYVYFQF